MMYKGIVYSLIQWKTSLYDEPNSKSNESNDDVPVHAGTGLISDHKIVTSTCTQRTPTLWTHALPYASVNCVLNIHQQIKDFAIVLIVP
jgi:hypothetical protein